MKRAFLLTLALFIKLTSLAHGELPGPYLGTSTDTAAGPEYRITFNFGIEQWENEKRSEEMNEQWLLNCNYPGLFLNKRTTYCSLDRTKFPLFFEGLEAEIITSSQKFYSSDGTLKIVNADWEGGFWQV